MGEGAGATGTPKARHVPPAPHLPALQSSGVVPSPAASSRKPSGVIGLAPPSAVCGATQNLGPGTAAPRGNLWGHRGQLLRAACLRAPRVRSCSAPTVLEVPAAPGPSSACTPGGKRPSPGVSGRRPGRGSDTSNPSQPTGVPGALSQSPRPVPRTGAGVPSLLCALPGSAFPPGCDPRDPPHTLDSAQPSSRP